MLIAELLNVVVLSLLFESNANITRSEVCCHVNKVTPRAPTIG